MLWKPISNWLTLTSVVIKLKFFMKCSAMKRIIYFCSFFTPFWKSWRDWQNFSNLIQLIFCEFFWTLSQPFWLLEEESWSLLSWVQTIQLIWPSWTLTQTSVYLSQDQWILGRHFFRCLKDHHSRAVKSWIWKWEEKTSSNKFFKAFRSIFEVPSTFWRR